MNLKKLASAKGLSAIKDLFLSVVAYALPAVALTFIIQPVMSRVVSDEVYGRFLTLLSVIRLLVGVFITSLANLRMLRQRDYEKAGVIGDFNLQLLLSMGLASLVLCGALLFYKSTSVWEYILCILTMLLIMAHDYFSVYYRVVIRYDRLVWDNLCILIGYFVGLAVYMVFPIWQIVMISGYVAGNLYVFLTSPYCKETLKTTGLLAETQKKHAQMGTSMLLRDSINYCDRLVIYPILGGGQVSVYNAASVVGKVIQLVSTPAQRVILSYIVRQDKLDKRNIKKLLLLSLPLLAVAYGGLYLVGRILLPIMYPQYAEAAAGILWIILLAILLNTCAALVNMILLRFDDMKVQIYVPVIRLVLYLGGALLLVERFGMMGFCWSFLASAVGYVVIVLLRLLMLCRREDKTA